MDALMKNTYHELVRDLFVFSVFTGLAYSDVKNLTADRLQTFFGTCLIPRLVRRTTGGMAKIMVAKAPGTVPSPKKSTAGIR